MPYAVGFVLLWLFCTVVYGDVFVRAARENFVSTNPTLMKFVTDQTWGSLYLVGRWLLLVYKNVWLGGTAMACVLTLTALLFDRAFGCRKRWAGVFFIVPVAELAYLLYIGTSLYHIGEPARVTVIPVCGLLVACIVGTVSWLLRKNKLEVEKPSAEAEKAAPDAEKSRCDLEKSPKESLRTLTEEKKNKPTPEEATKRQPRMVPGMVAVCVACGLLIAGAYAFCGKEMLRASMKNDVEDCKWDAVIEQGLSTEHPDRTIATYYTIALLQKGLLLDRLFEFSFNFEDARLTDKSQNEGTLYTLDANFYAGLTNICNENCVNMTVLSGPRLNVLKRMTLCAILNDERELARKYLRIIDEMPFEHDFVEKYSAYVGNEQLILSDPVLSFVLSLRPREERFEQQYRQPAFLGYNVGLLSGSDNTLVTSVAACLYSKNLPLVMTRAEIMQQRQTLPIAVQQAIAIAAIKDKSVYKRFPRISDFVKSQVSRFANQAVPMLNDKEKMRETLKDAWKGSYLYYYYCMNAPKTKEDTKAEDKGGVN